MSLIHLIVIDPATSRRETSFVVPIHGKTYDELEAKARADYPEYLYLRDDDGTLQAQLTNQDTYWLNNKVEIRPSQLHDWDGEKWVLNQQRQAELANEKRQQLIDSIDNTAAQYLDKWTRFTSEYDARESAALAYQSADYQGEASVFITGFAQAAGLDLRTATELILKQAVQLRTTLEQMSVLRMRKYELKQPNLTLDEMQKKHDDIIAQMQALAEAQQ
ncbi:hypothetical protein [Gallibacterium anatis]|uniref:hypothetical protein n=1 Tax=Gallibacterium anatis TaxID=750 RepID=UPI000530DF63|nr:hypothetical protein [Gallibacterium anatis]KGQ39967.1 hypothetical protein JP30_09160 [Gallibacterium anatis IPDH697-78]